MRVLDIYFRLQEINEQARALQETLGRLSDEVMTLHYELEKQAEGRKKKTIQWGKARILSIDNLKARRLWNQYDLSCYQVGHIVSFEMDENDSQLCYIRTEQGKGTGNFPLSDLEIIEDPVIVFEGEALGE